MTRRAWALAAVSVVGVLAGVPALAAAPQQGASMLSDDAERKAHEALERDRRERDLARARAARSPNPRRLAGQSDRQALQTALATFPRLFAARPTRLLAPRPDERVVAYLGDYAARLDVPGKADAIVSSDLPLRVGANGAKRPVDLVLVDRGDRFGPKDPIVDATFPRRADAALTVGDSVALKLLGADPKAVAQQAGQQLVYPNALHDADLLATPLPTGLETFVQLRSADSPTDLAFGFELPPGARLVADRDGTTPAGGVSIVRGGVEIGRVHPPSAVDAAGDPVAVTTSVRDATLTLNVDVRADTPFPVSSIPSSRVSGTTRTIPTAASSTRTAGGATRPSGSPAFCGRRMRTARIMARPACGRTHTHRTIPMRSSRSTTRSACRRSRR